MEPKGPKDYGSWLESMTAEERAALVKQLAGKKAEEKEPWEVTMMHFAVFIGLMAIATMVHGYTVRAMWSWFIVPGFHVEAISLKTCVGLGCLVTFFRVSGSNTREDESESRHIMKWYASPLMSMFLYSICYGVAAVWHWVL